MPKRPHVVRDGDGLNWKCERINLMYLALIFNSFMSSVIYTHKYLSGFIQLIVENNIDPSRKLQNVVIYVQSTKSAALSPATQHAMPPEFSRKWGTECLDTKFPLT